MTSGAVLVRPAEERDLKRLTAIYNHYVIETAITFAARAAAINCTRAGAEPPTREEMGLD